MMTQDERKAMCAVIDAVRSYAGELGGPQAIRLLDKLSLQRDRWPTTDQTLGYPNPQVIRDMARAMERIAAANRRQSEAVAAVLVDQIARAELQRVPWWQLYRRRRARARTFETASTLVAHYAGMISP